MTPDEVWTLLVAEAGAREDGRDMFLLAVRGTAARGPTESLEYRFMGSLGFGGKVWWHPGSSREWYVTCYREDETPERLAVIKAVNARLAGGARA